jgi:gluconate 5-dehydrogenase
MEACIPLSATNDCLRVAEKREFLLDLLSRFSLAGRGALVTGSSRGIGLAIAGALASAGASIIINGRDTEGLGNVAETLASKGAAVKALAFDVANEESVQDAISYCEAELGAIDILVNNAGMQFRSPLQDFPTDKFEQVMSVNVTSVFHVSRTVARHMIGRRQGKIINICSIMSAVSRPSIAPYAASKAAVANLTRGMATDWARHGLNINGIAPGYFRTELNTALLADPQFNAWLEQRTPMGRWGDVEELGGAAVFLASEASSFVNGHILYVDGAFSATV